MLKVIRHIETVAEKKKTYSVVNEPVNPKWFSGSHMRPVGRERTNRNPGERPLNRKHRPRPAFNIHRSERISPRQFATSCTRDQKGTRRAVCGRTAHMATQCAMRVHDLRRVSIAVTTTTADTVRQAPHGSWPRAARRCRSPKAVTGVPP